MTADQWVRLIPSVLSAVSIVVLILLVVWTLRPGREREPRGTITVQWECPKHRWHYKATGDNEFETNQKLAHAWQSHLFHAHKDDRGDMPNPWD